MSSLTFIRSQKPEKKKASRAYSKLKKTSSLKTLKSVPSSQIPAKPRRHLRITLRTAVDLDRSSLYPMVDKSQGTIAFKEPTK